MTALLLSEEDVQRIATAVAAKLQQVKTEWLTAQQAAGYLHISTSTLYKTPSIPRHRRGGKLLFLRSELDTYVSDC